eukprot:9859011-Alexandrium_andersonii.AAC.1
MLRDAPGMLATSAARCAPNALFAGLPVAARSLRRRFERHEPLSRSCRRAQSQRGRGLRLQVFHVEGAPIASSGRNPGRPVAVASNP